MNGVFLDAMQLKQNTKPECKGKLEVEALKRLSSSFVISNFKGYALFHEKAVDAKWPPNAKGAERPKKEADKSSLSANEFNRELSTEPGSWATAGHSAPSIIPG